MLIPLLEPYEPSSPPAIVTASVTLPTVLLASSTQSAAHLRPGSYWLPYGSDPSLVPLALDNGAGRVVIEVSQLEKSEEALHEAFAQVIPSAIVDRAALRTTLPLSSTPLTSAFLARTLSLASVVLVRIQADETSMGGSAFEEVLLKWTDEWTVPEGARLVLELPFPISTKAIGALDARYIDVAFSTNLLTLGETTVTTQGKLPLGEALLAPVTSERADGLFPSMVVDEQGIGLGLVYSNASSVSEALRTGRGVYWSRKRGLWRKGETSGAGQILRSIDIDCDRDTLCFTVQQIGSGFCHLQTRTCFGEGKGVTHLQRTLQSRLENAPPGSYTARLFSDPSLLRAKIFEEAEELCAAKTKAEVAWEAGDLLYFSLALCVQQGVSLAEVERELDRRSGKVTRRPGNAKAPYMARVSSMAKEEKASASKEQENKRPSDDKAQDKKNSAMSKARILMKHHKAEVLEDPKFVKSLLQRPIIESDDIIARVRPILEKVRTEGDAGVCELTAKFDGVTLDTPVLRAPFPKDQLANLSPKVKAAIDQAYNNIKAFHEAQYPKGTLEIETQPGVVCSRFARPIDRVGLYVPGGTAILPSTALMLGVPAQVAGCKEIIVACPPRRADGLCSPEVLYAAQKIGASTVVLAGGAQAVASMAYGTESVPKVDKICGPGNQYVTAAKMIVQNDASSMVSIDMPAGPSELLVVADETCTPAYVASDLLSQAEHGPDSQVVLLAAGMSDALVQQIEEEVEKQGEALPRRDIVRLSIPKSYILRVPSLDKAMEFSNAYAPEHLILHVDQAERLVEKVQHAGSVFVGPYSPESCGDYASGTNHTLPTYGYARMYSGVSTDSFLKYITAQTLTRDGLNGLGDTVMALAEVEGLEAHRNAVAIRLRDIRQ